MPERANRWKAGDARLESLVEDCFGGDAGPVWDGKLSVHLENSGLTDFASLRGIGPWPRLEARPWCSDESVRQARHPAQSSLNYNRDVCVHGSFAPVKQ